MSVEQEILVTGIKVVDLLAPYAKGGKIGLLIFYFFIFNFYFFIKSTFIFSHKNSLLIYYCVCVIP